MLGHLDVARLLLAAGVDPNHRNPDGYHAHATPLHHAALAGNLPMVQLLLDQGARFDIRDTLWKATAAGWAEHGGRDEVLAFLRALEGGARG